MALANGPRSEAVGITILAPCPRIGVTLRCDLYHLQKRGKFPCLGPSLLIFFTVPSTGFHLAPSYFPTPTCVHTDTHTPTHIHAHARTRTCTHAHTTYMYTHKHTHLTMHAARPTYAHMHIHTDTHRHIYPHAHKHPYTYMHTHDHMYTHITVCSSKNRFLLFTYYASSSHLTVHDIPSSQSHQHSGHLSAVSVDHSSLWGTDPPQPHVNLRRLSIM